MDRNMGMGFCKFDTCNNGPISAFCGLRGATRRVQASGIESFPETGFEKSGSGLRGYFRKKIRPEFRRSLLVVVVI
jgi:hypothetical protein